MRGEVNVAVNAWQHLRILVVKKIRYIVIHSVAAGVLASDPQGHLKAVKLRVGAEEPAATRWLEAARLDGWCCRCRWP
jgi:hypothetical protein